MLAVRINTRLAVENAGNQGENIIMSKSCLNKVVKSIEELESKETIK